MKCPGEKVCTTTGRISQKVGETLQTYCKPERCELYHTKPGSIPATLEGEVAAAFTLHRKADRGITIDESAYPHWWIDSYHIYRDARDEVDNEPDDQKPGSGAGAAGVVTVPKGDSGAFDFVLPNADQVKT